MILIIGEHNDVSTDKVCAWLNYYNADFIRVNSYLNSDNILSNIELNNEKLNFQLIINNRIYDLDEIDAIWCRRGYLSITIPNHTSLNLAENNIPKEIGWHLQNESDTLNGYFEYVIEQKFHINNKNHYNSNKLIALSTAKKYGLRIPTTLVTRERDVLKEFISENKEVITKNIQDTLSYKDGKYIFGHCTKDVDHITTDKFFYSLFQNKIISKYELRIFYLNGKFFAHAALSPSESKSTDIRRSGRKNRYIPFDIPEDIKTKIKLFMDEMKLESGSIDMIVDENNEYYFLEVNPVGQFGYLSGYNNYYIEREIAKELINGKTCSIS